MIGLPMERATKLIVLLWTCAALSAVVYLTRPAWPLMPVAAIVAFAGMAVATTLTPRGVGVILAAAYVSPILIRLLTGQNHFAFAAVWLAGLVGAMLPDAARTGWHVPRAWRPALVCWALTVVAGGTIVVAREFDFTTALLHARVSNSSTGASPSHASTWSLHVSLVLVTGILWFDWLFGLRDEDFRPAVAWPLALSCLPMVGVALYQLFADVTFLNRTDFSRFDRATGTVMDANVCGTIAALWIGGAALLLTPLRTPGRALVLVAAIGACGLAVWASGSRTALAAAVIVLAFVVRDALRSSDIRASASPATRAVAAAVVVAALASGVYIAASRHTSAAGPLDRMRDLLPDLRAESLSRAAAELWNRNEYGAIAARMFRDAPMFGVGAGSFHVVQADFARLAGLPVLSADNAQNWFRHQLAEFGFVGSLGWIAWVVAFGAFILRHGAGERPHATIAMGMVVAFATISLVGMPGQEVPTALTFWTSAFWYASLARPVPLGEPRSSRRELAVIVAVLATFAAGTLVQARTTLRVPVRALRVGWPYSYGIYPAETDAAGGAFRWTDRHGVIVLEAPTRFLALTATPNPLAGVPGRNGSSPVPLHLVLTTDGCRVIDERVASTAPITRLVDLHHAAGRVMVETRVDRTYRPSDFGFRDDRRLGMMLRWAFVERAATAPVSCNDPPPRQPD
jgi:O-Antigen ligase